MTAFRIPFNKPALVGNELRNIREAVESGQLSGDGMFTEKCSRLLETALGVERVFLCPSCTHALEMCALLLELEPGDEVIVPSFAFVTTANAFATHGARIVFADVRPDTLNLDERRVKEKITARTRAIVALHYAGVACEMDELLRVSTEAGVPIVEDCAHGLFGTYRGRNLGTLGRFGTLSFHETKNFTCGEGGALLINEPEWIERAEILRQKGTDRGRFLRGQVDRYTWVDFGSSYLPSEVQAAFLYAQLEHRAQIQARREALWRRYREELADWAGARGVALPHVPDRSTHPAHLFYLLLPSLAGRDALAAHLRKQGILAVFHYQPLHRSAMGRRFGGLSGDCPVAEDVSERLLRLPLYNSLTDDEQREVIDAVRAFEGP
jgi:dTDP-4-amino-4,6-dideoxygalactose transaminase